MSTSIQQFQQAIKQIKGDANWLSKLSGATDVNDFVRLSIQFSQEKGIQLDEKTLRDAIGASPAQFMAELNEEELDAVAGGLRCDDLGFTACRVRTDHAEPTMKRGCTDGFDCSN